MDFSFADFEIDVAQHELRRKGEIVPIEPQVFDLLVHLVRNRDRVVTKKDLIDVVWQGRVISEATLNSRVFAARRAIGDNGEVQLFIRTHHKRGFRFVGQVENSVPPSAFKGETVDVREVARELGVRYVLEGSVRKAASRVRVTAQLIDASKGVHLWADRYDRELANIFELQDEITNKVIDSVGPQIIVAEAARVRRKPPQNIDAWDLVMQALPHMWHMSTEEQRHAQDLLQQAIALDPEYAHAHALLGWTYVNMFNLDSGTPIGEFTDQALDAGERAVTLDEQDHWGHLVLGLGHARRRRPETAVMHLSQAVELNPNFALGYAGLGYAFACGGQPERGLEALEQAQRLSPRDPFLAIYAPVVRYMALFALQRYEETIALCRSITTMNPNHAGAWRLMTVSMGLLGRINEAREALARTLALQPDLSSAHVTNDTVYANPSDRARFLLGLQKAGLKN